MELKEEMVSQQTVYEGIIVNVRRDKARLLDGRIANREVVEHPGGVGILALDDEGCAVLVEQYRYVFGRTLLEIPAGKREPGEEPFVTAQRELKEEVGATAADWQPLGQIIASPGCYDEVLHLYLARGLTFGDTHPDEDEFLSVRRIPFQELVQRCLSGEIQDGKTVTAVLKAKFLLGL